MVEVYNKEAALFGSIFMALLFGFHGFHRCYVGDVGIGIAQFLTCGGCCIWSCIDWINIEKIVDKANEKEAAKRGNATTTTTTTTTTAASTFQPPYYAQQQQPPPQAYPPQQQPMMNYQPQPQPQPMMDYQPPTQQPPPYEG